MKLFNPWQTTFVLPPPLRGTPCMARNDPRAAAPVAPPDVAELYGGSSESSHDSHRGPSSRVPRRHRTPSLREPVKQSCEPNRIRSCRQQYNSNYFHSPHKCFSWYVCVVSQMLFFSYRGFFQLSQSPSNPQTLKPTPTVKPHFSPSQVVWFGFSCLKVRNTPRQPLQTKSWRFA